MNKKTGAATETPETKDFDDQEETTFGIVPILIISLFIGLIAGAGIGTSQILPVTFVVAVIMYLNRKKIAASDKVTQASKEGRNDVSSDQVSFTWPSTDQFAFSVAVQSHQNAIQQLILDYPVSDTGKNGIYTLQARLVPENDNPYDSNAVRIDIDGRTIGYLTREQAGSFRHRLEAGGLQDQTTMCQAIIVRKVSDDTGKPCYKVKLDIEPF